VTEPSTKIFIDSKLCSEVSFYSQTLMEARLSGFILTDNFKNTYSTKVLWFHLTGMSAKLRFWGFRLLIGQCMLCITVSLQYQNLWVNLTHFIGTKLTLMETFAPPRLFFQFSF